MGTTFWVLCLLLVAVFVLGGGARGDIQSLMVLRPVAIVALGFGLGGLRLSHISGYRFLCLTGLAIALLPALQLIPLPPALWRQLPGRSLVDDIGQVAGLGEIWRPLSLDPQATLNALYAMSVPLAVLVLGIQLDRDLLGHVLAVILALGAISAVLGLMQTLGDPSGPLFFYQITNPGTPVGLFANHNHQALMLACMLPMIAVFAEPMGKTTQLVALISALLLLPLILMTGSRAGLIAAAAAIVAVPFVLPHRNRTPAPTVRGRWGFQWRATIVAASLALLLVGLTVWFGRGLAWERLVGGSVELDGRLRILPTVVAMIGAYFPWGTGMGSFEKVYQVHEPDALLGPEYMNHAHNDWLEIALNGGLAAVVLLVMAAMAFLRRTWRLFADDSTRSPDLTHARLGLVLVALMGLASLADYPLRVPSLGALFVLASLWAGCPFPQFRASNVSKSNDLYG